MIIEKIKTEYLKPAKYNPRKDLKPGDLEYEKLRRSMHEFGCVEPIVWNKKTGNVVGGHQRLKVLLADGATVIDCVVVELDPEREKALNLALNKIQGDWDQEKLALIIEDLKNTGFDLTITGFTPVEIDELLETTSTTSLQGDDFDIDKELKKPVITQMGDLWLLGKHRLICGDATDRKIIDELMNNKKAQMINTDPPYGVNYKSQSGKFDEIKNDNLSHDDLMTSLLMPAFRNYVEFSDFDAAFYIWYASINKSDFKDAMTTAGLLEKQNIIWVKNNFVLGHADYHWAHEECIYAEKAGHSARFYGDRTQKTVWKVITKGKHTTATILTGGVVITDGTGGKIYLNDRPPKNKKIRHIRLNSKTTIQLCSESTTSTVWEVAKENTPQHPTQKPLELSVIAINNSSKPGDIVADYFGGSGSTLIACEQTGRVCYTAEIDEKYCDVIINRYIDLKKATKDVFLVRNGQKRAFKEIQNEGYYGKT